MQWLPPTYRIIFSKELPFNKEQLVYIEKKLNSYIDSGCLFCSLDKTLPDIIARVVNVELNNNKFCFYADEIKYNIFRKLNVHLENYFMEIEMDFTFKDSNPCVSNILKLKEIKDV